MIFFFQTPSLTALPLVWLVVSADRMRMPSLLRRLQRWTRTNIHSNTTLSTSQCSDMAPGPTLLSSSSRLWATGNLSQGVGEIRRGGKEMGC